MFKRNLIAVFVLGLLFTFVTSINAQEKPIEKKENKMMMQDGDMEKCMDKIAADGQMRDMMMNKMMEHMKADSSGMMQMCKMMTDNPEMNKMRINMMGDMTKDCGMMKDKMIKDSTKTMNKSEHESHHK